MNIFDKNINSYNQKDTNTYENINQYINKHNEKNNNSSNNNHNDNTTIINKANISAIRNELTNNNNVQHNPKSINNELHNTIENDNINKSTNIQKEINIINNKYKENNKDKNNYFFESTKRKLCINSSDSNKRKKAGNTEIMKINHYNNTLIEPYIFKDIFKLKDKKEWLTSVKEELDNMKKHKVYSIVDKVPSGSNIISSRWVFKYKRDSNGKVIKRKARLVAKGYTQEYGIDIRKRLLLHSNKILLESLQSL